MLIKLEKLKLRCLRTCLILLNLSNVFYENSELITRYLHLMQSHSLGFST